MKFKFIRDKKGVAEEFTSLPAIMVVMIGFSIFFSMIATVYHLHNERMEDKELFEVAHYIAMKLTNIGSPLLAEVNTPLILDKNRLYATNELAKLKEYCNPIGYDYCVRIYEYKDNKNRDLIANIGDEISNKNKASASRKVAITDGIETNYGELVVIVWRE